MLTGIYDETFKEMFLPTYSSPLNPIEVLWSVVKRKWTKQLYHLTEELAQLHNT
jgi:transposase